MEIREELERVLQELPEERLREVLDFARFLSLGREAEQWQAYGLQQLAAAYGENEPEYTLADVKPERSR